MARNQIRFPVTEYGRKESVPLPFKEHHEIMDDLADRVTIAERKDEPSEGLDSVQKRLEGKWQSTE